MVRTVFGVIGAVVIVVALAVAGWQFNWWLNKANVNRQVGVDNQNKGTQTAWRDQVNQNIADFYLVPTGNTAARGALRVQICDMSSRLNSNYRTDQIDTFRAKECN